MLHAHVQLLCPISISIYFLLQLCGSRYWNHLRRWELITTWCDASHLNSPGKTCLDSLNQLSLELLNRWVPLLWPHQRNLDMLTVMMWLWVGSIVVKFRKAMVMNWGSISNPNFGSHSLRYVSRRAESLNSSSCLKRRRILGCISPANIYQSKFWHFGVLRWILIKLHL